MKQFSQWDLPLQSADELIALAESCSGEQYLLSTNNVSVDFSHH